MDVPNYSVLDTRVSRFQNALSTSPTNINLFEWLIIPNEPLRFLVDQIRASTDKFQRDLFKKQLPSITPSGVFTARKKSCLVQHSGLIAFDIDNIGDSAGDVKSALSEIPNIAYCGLSVSGQGLWGLIPISNAANHEAHFRAIELAFAGIGVTIDKACKDVSRLRFYSYDNEAYINHNAVVFDQVYYDPPSQTKPTYRPERNINTSTHVNKIISRAVNMVLNSQDGHRHEARNKAAFLLGGYIGAGLINEDEAKQALYDAVIQRTTTDKDAFKQIDRGIKDGQLKPVRI